MYEALDVSENSPLDMKREQQWDDSFQFVLLWLQGSLPVELYIYNIRSEEVCRTFYKTGNGK